MIIEVTHDRCDVALTEFLADLVRQGYPQEQVMAAVGYVCGRYNFTEAAVFRDACSVGHRDRIEELHAEEDASLSKLEDKIRRLEEQTRELSALIDSARPVTESAP